MQALLPRWVVPVVPEGRVLENHAVIIDRDRIRAVVEVEALAADWPEVERIELPERALIPGLVNMHTHSAMALLRGLADDLPLMRWLHENIWPAEKLIMGPDYVLAGTRLAMAEMLRSGTTCFNDNYFFPDVTTEAALAAGMRAVVGMPVIGFPTPWAETEDEYFRRGLEVHQHFSTEELVGVSFVPHAPYSVGDSAFRRIRTLAEELDINVHLHLLEARGEIEGSREQYGLHPLDRLDALGLLGPRLLAVHMTQLVDADLPRLARAGVHVVHCPDSNMKLASGICPVAGLDRAGVNVCIGTDGAASNNDLSLLAEMRQTALLAKVSSGDPEAIPAARALSMATLHGARALGMEDRIGSIESGKCADLAAIRLDRIETQPVYDVISQIVYAAQDSQVTDVWVAGQRVLQDRQLTTLSEDQILDECRDWQSRISSAIKN
ncbi:MAG: N-ethylammeline chlorohydrolase [Gammaproteobacteria bacterium HGW-Gammaproteobacteria-8]|nr:MAG: N-ethylammeline chlorohydrolase [Gammaproteobacteria bacterium HGW-Gammaproteobacteria-8]